MHFKLLCILLVLLKLTAARYTVPKFYSQENGVDKANKLYPLGAPFKDGYRYRPMQMYPMYHIIPPGARLPYLKPTTTTTTTTTAPTTLPPPVNDRLAEFPRDLLEIAKTKLGLRNLDEIPSISELGELLGTKSTEETIKYVRQLTSTDEGVALMKAYIESSDYTNSAGTAPEEADALNEKNEEYKDDNNEEDDTNDDNNEEEDSVDEDDEEADFVTTSTTAKPQPGFLERMKSYLNIYNLMPQQQEEVVSKPLPPPTTPAPIVMRPRMPLPVQRPPLPYHYPIPIRPVSILQKQQNSIANMSPTTPPQLPPHLNTPNIKALRMHIATLSKIVQVPPMELEAFLLQKPKVLQLVHKLGRIPLNRDGSWPGMHGELWAAAKKVLEQDDDMRKMLNGPR